MAALLKHGEKLATRETPSGRIAVMYAPDLDDVVKACRLYRACAVEGAVCQK